MSDNQQNNNKSVKVSNSCIGCGVCTALCPEVFVMNTETGQVEIQKGANNSLPCVQEALEACPVQAIESEK